MTITREPETFIVRASDAEIDDLRARVRAWRAPAPLAGDDWGTGVPLSVLASMAQTWAEEFDWRAIEERLRGIPQFLVEIDGQPIHYAHVRSSQADAVPLLLCHGWPGSYLEFLDIVPLLTDPGSGPAFHVVIPSVPGFAFSTPLRDGDWTTDRVAGAFAELMAHLGYDRYVVQGGDYGAGVAPAMGRLDPDHCAAIHVNGSIGAPMGEPDDEEKNRSSGVELDRYRRVAEFMQSEFGYIAIQSTRPQLIGVAMTDSPMGQLAWMLDKFRAWTFPFDAEPDGRLGRDRILAHVTLYWLTRSAGSAAYTVYAAESGDWGSQPEKPWQPVGAIMFAHDIGIRRLAERDVDIVRWTEVTDHGGHFAAMEEPAELAADLRALVNQVW
ncbi:epoxide hydrolase [Microbacterium invictum]|uniref:Epoxide hydrolase n=1 Tax=Microbacterium invictum TaxID=515415 RepID=A0ABZ0VBE6_9MICO|nr:epoxide hydrolase [Microbacterium invictum]WQB70444.1 epoxide hydrolase [Microbacterium invictum]